MLTELLIQLSAVAEEQRVFVVGATNRPADLDPALMRRFDRRLQARRSPDTLNLHAPQPTGRDAALGSHQAGARRSGHVDLWPLGVRPSGAANQMPA